MSFWEVDMVHNIKISERKKTVRWEDILEVVIFIYLLQRLGFLGCAFLLVKGQTFICWWTLYYASLT